MPDYEDMIARQEEIAITAHTEKLVRYAERIDREPEYVCGLFEED